VNAGSGTSAIGFVAGGAAVGTSNTEATFPGLGGASVAGARVVGAGVAAFGTIDALFGGGPRLATMAAASAAIGDGVGVLASSAAGVAGPDLSLGKRGLPRPGDRLEGSVLLRCTPDAVGVTNAGVIGLGTAPEWRERFEDVDTFLRTPPYLRRLSAPALEDVDAERPIAELLRPGVVGDRT
jgi:hypothetical protein